MGAVVVCGRAKSAPEELLRPEYAAGRSPANRARRARLPSTGPVAGHLPPQARRRGRPPRPGTAHDPGMRSLCPAADRPPRSGPAGGPAPRPRPGHAAAATRCPSASGRSSRRPRWSPVSTRRTRPGAPATAASTCSARRAKRCTRRWPARCRFAGVLAGRGVVVVDHGDTRTTYEPVEATVPVGQRRRPRRGRSATCRPSPRTASRAPACTGAGSRGPTYLDPLDLVGAGAGPAAAAVARRCRSRWPARW